MKKLFLSILAITLNVAATAKEGAKSIVISNLDSSSRLDIPVEWSPGALTANNRLWQAEVDGKQATRFLLQSAPALFGSSNGIEMKRTYCAVLPKGAGEGRRELKATANANVSFKFVEMEGERLKLLQDDLPVLVYNYGMQLAAGAPAEKRRSSYVHPVYDMLGQEITDDFPRDHYHHRGLSWMWPRMTIAGRQYSLWDMTGIWQRFDRWLGQEVGPVCATLGVKNSWHLADRKVADEWVWLRVFRAGELGRAIDIVVTIKALEAIQLLGAERKGYGGVVFRLAPRDSAIITTPDSVLTRDSDHLAIPWADQSAIFAHSGQFTGVAIFQHADNPAFPSEWCLRHYGFLGVSWPGLTPVVLQLGVPVTLRYRIWLHHGNAQAGGVEDAYRVFASPPIATLE